MGKGRERGAEITGVGEGGKGRCVWDRGWGFRFKGLLGDGV